MILNSKLLLWDYLIFFLAPMRAVLMRKITAVFMKIVATAQAVHRTGHLVKTGTVAITTTMLCRDLIRMRIMIFNASASIIFGTTFGVTFGTRKLFQKKYTHAETLVIQMLPRVVYTISLSKFSNLRHKTPSAPKIFTPLL